MKRNTYNKKIHCPVCQSIQVVKLLNPLSTHGKKILSKKERFTYFLCQECKTLFLYGIKLDNNYYKKHYSFEGYQEGKKGFLGEINKYLEKRSVGKKLEYIYKYKNKRKMRILDVGCGSGAFLLSLNPKRFESVGLELNQEEYEVAKKKGLTVIKADILSTSKNIGKFDVITLWHVVEHIENSLKLFTELKKYLKPNGVILFSTPNSMSWGRKIGKERWFHLDAPRHVVIFDEHGIQYITQQANLTLKQSFSHTFEFPLDLFWSLPSPLRYISLPFYPIMKYFSKETMTYILTS